MGEKAEKGQMGEFYFKLATSIWDSVGSEFSRLKPGLAGHVMSPHSVVTGIQDAVDPDGSIDSRIAGGLGASAGLASKYAFAAEKLGAKAVAKWLGAYAGGIGFITTAWDILSMMGKGYEAGHKIASAKGESAGAIISLKATTPFGVGWFL